MKRLQQIMPGLRDIVFFVFNVSAMRKACVLHLLSREFLLGFSLWGISVGIILLQIVTHISVPTFLFTAIKIFSVFSGCCWVAFPAFIYLEIKMHQQVQKTLKASQLIQPVTGVSLWRQAVQGRLSVQFLSAVVLGVWLAFFAFYVPMNTSWQVLFILAFVLNAIFFVVFPLLLFLGRGMQRGFHQGRKPLTGYNEA